MYLISDLKTELEGVVHGTSTSKIRNLNELIYRAGRQVLLDVDPPETKRIVEIQNALFDDVSRYAVPSDLKGNKILDIRPQVNRVVSDSFDQRFVADFDLYRDEGTFAIENDDGTSYIRIEKTLNQGITINSADSLTTNGTWSASAGTLSLDTLYYLTGSGSLKLDTISNGAYIENTSMTAVDLTDHIETASVFVGIYLPTSTDVTNLTSLDLRWGSDATANYYSDNETSTFDSTAFHVGWNIIQFDWTAAGKTGSPTATAYDSLRLIFNTSGTLTNVRIDSFMSRLPSIYEIVYYSNSLYRTSSGTFKEKHTLDTDIVNLGTDGYSLLFDQCAFLAAQQVQGRDGSADIKFFGDRYADNLKLYNSFYPTEYKRPHSSYYRFRKTGSSTWRNTAT
jgi:hypothetical protein